jgi:heme iron utilization protein
MAVNPIRPTDDGARALAKTLIRTARHCSLASLEGKDGFPSASLAALATDNDGTPHILMSRLSNHTRNLLADPRASLLIGEIGKGDALAHPRITLFAHAREVLRGTADHTRLRRRFLAKNPKAALYVDFGDFLFMAFNIERASLNGGFGKAFELTRGDVLTDVSGAAEIVEREEEMLKALNAGGKERLALLAPGASGAAWRATGIDPEGIDLARGDKCARHMFETQVRSAAEFNNAVARKL